MTMRIGVIYSATREHPKVMCDGMDLSDSIPTDQADIFKAAIVGTRFAFQMFSRDVRGQMYRRGKVIARHTVEAVVDALEFVE